MAQARAAEGKVTTRGIVTFIDARNITIQDGTAGIVVRIPANDAAIALGMEMTATGDRGAFRGLEQIELKEGDGYALGAVQDLPEPKPVTIEEITADPTAEAFESERIIISGATMGATEGQNTPVTQYGHGINIFRMPTLSEITAGDVVDIIAILSQYDAYQLRVASPGDIVLGTNPDDGTIAISEARSLSGVVKVRGVATYIDGRNVVIQDSTAGINLFLPSTGHGITLGDEVTAEGTRGAFNQLEQIASITDFAIGAKKPLPTPVNVTLKDLKDPAIAEPLESQRVRVTDVELGTMNPAGDTVVTQDGVTLVIRKIPVLQDIVAGDRVDVIAAVGQFRENYQLMVGDAAHITKSLFDPISDEMATGYTTLDAAYGLDNGAVTTIIGQVAYKFGGNSILVQDVIGGDIVGFQIYDFTRFSEYVVGDIVAITGTIGAYGGVKQLSPVTALEVLDTETAPFAPQEVTVRELLNSADAYLSEFVVVREATLGTWSETGSTPITDATGTIAIFRGAPYPVGVKAGDVVDVLAGMSKFNTTLQLRLGSSSDYVILDDTEGPILTLPTFLPARAHEDYTVSIDAVDNVAVRDVMLEYAYDGRTFEPLTMVQHETTLKYQATIPGTDLVGTDKVTLTFTATDVNGNETVKTVDVAVVDRPQVVSVLPAPNSATLEEKRPTFLVELFNAGANPKVELILGDAAPVEMSVVGSTATYRPETPMADGKVTAKVTITRGDDVVSEPYEWSFFVGESLFNFYFGQLHAHTNYSDGAGTPDQALEYAKNAEQVDFLALTDHSNYFDTASNLGTFDNPNSGIVSTVDPSMSKWAYYKTFFDRHTTEDFVALYGFEMTWSGQYGHINTFNSNGFVSRNDPKLSARDGVGLKAYYDLLKEQENTISMFNHPGRTFGTFNDFAFYDPIIDSRIQLIEVANGEGAVGSSGYFPSYEYYTMALDKGWHLAPTNGQDNHKGRWGDSNTARTVVISDSLTKDALYEAMENMMVYATEDNNLEVFYTVNGMPMGTVFTQDLDVVDIVVDINDPDINDIIGTVKVIVNGGIVAHSETIHSNCGKMEVSLPNDYSYYYIMIEQADGDIAVTAPVWTGQVTQVGINSVEKNTSMDILGETTNVETTFFNYEAKDATLTLVEYHVDGVLVERLTEGLPVLAKGGLTTMTYDFVPRKVGPQTLSVYAEAVLDGVPMAFTQTLQLNVYDNQQVVDVAIDASHANFYVSGDYANSDVNFTEVAAFYGARVHRITEGITPASLEGMELLVLTVPYPGFGRVAPGYTEDELAAIRDFAEQGGNIILTSKSDRGNAGGESNADHISNTILEAIGAKARVAEGIVVDNVKKSNEAYRLSFTEDGNFNYDAIFAEGVEEDSNRTFSAYNAAPIIANGATPVVKGYATTWGASYTKDFTGSAYVPDYEKDTVVVPMGEVNVLTEEVLPGGGFLLTSGVTFFSTFEVKVEMIQDLDARTVNYQLLANVFNAIKGEPEITAIREVQEAEEGRLFTVEGILTSNASGFDRTTAFFDSAYVQDETGGINIFPIAGDYQAGQKVRITGTTSSYQGEHQLNIHTLELIDATVNPVAPTRLLTAEVPEHLGLLVEVEGIVQEIHVSMDVVESILVMDESGEAIRVFIDGYIGVDVPMPQIMEGDTVRAIGLSSIDPLGNRIRVRDRKEVFLVETADAVDKTALAEALEAAKALDASLYTEESMASLTEAMELAEGVLADEEATQEAVDQALAALMKAMEELVENPGAPVEEVTKEALRAALEEAKALDAADYKAESFEALTEAMLLAEIVLLDEEATQEVVDQALAALLAAMEALQPGEPDIVTPLPGTGSQRALPFYLVGSGLLAMGYLVLRRREMQNG